MDESNPVRSLASRTLVGTVIREVDVVSAVVSWYWSCELKHLKALRAETFDRDGIEVLMPCFSEAEDVHPGGKPELLDLVDLLVH